jgi:hypothetical protein
VSVHAVAEQSFQWQVRRFYPASHARCMRAQLLSSPAVNPFPSQPRCSKLRACWLLLLLLLLLQVTGSRWSGW